MAKEKLLLCGATGFIGRNLLARYRGDQRYDVHATHFRRPSVPLDGVTWHQADLRDPTDVARVVEGAATIIQAAATTSGSKDIVSTPYIHVTDNAVMNSYLFRSAFEHKVKRLIFFSCSVMYPSSERPLKERDYHEGVTIHPRYFGAAHTKLYLERLCEFFANVGETQYTAIRHSNVYGPHDKFDLEHSHVFGATVTKVMTATDKIVVWGSGEEQRDLIFVDDLIDLVELALTKQRDKFRLYNCGSGEPVSIRSLVEQIIAASGRELQIEHDLSSPTIKTSFALDCHRAHDELGWKPQTTLGEGIARTISWWKENVAQ